MAVRGYDLSNLPRLQIDPFYDGGELTRAEIRIIRKQCRCLLRCLEIISNSYLGEVVEGVADD